MTPPDMDPNAAPFNPLPPVVIALVAVIAGIELLFTLGARGLIGGPEAVGWRLAAVQDWAFADVIFEWMRSNNRWPVEQLARFVTYPLIHASFTHALFVVVFILAMGKMVGEAFGGFAFLAIFFLSAVAGALGYGLLLTEDYPLVGGYPGVYGLIGGFTYLMWTSLDAVGQNRLRAFSLIGMLLGIQLVFGLLFGSTNEWVADLTGFLTGFALSFVVSPGGWQRLLARLRQR